MKPRLRILFVALLLACGLAGAPSALADSLNHFITARGDKLWDGDREFRYVSINLPDALQIICEAPFDGDFGATRFRLPDEYELRDGIETVRQLGGRVVRAFVITCHRGYDPRFMFDTAPDPVRGNEQALLVLDKLLQICREKGVRVYLPLVAANSPAIRGDVTTYGPDFWVIGSPANRRFKSMVAQLLNRTNRFTGIRYADDTAIFGWETGNELQIGDNPERKRWLHDLAAYVRSLDPHHLIIDGRNHPGDVYGKYDEFFADPNISLLSYHTYHPLPGKDVLESQRIMRAYTRGRKPMIVGEIAMTTPVPVLKALLDEIIADGTVGANFWANRFHNRDGGFYKHSDRGSLYEDLDWPGFAPGRTHADQVTHEAQLEDVLADRAYRIQNLSRPALPVPGPATLLPIGDPGHISWQGSTGARAYDVDRATTASGPWRIVGHDIQDNLAAYAPLYCDDGAEPGAAYYYRVIAKNESGSAAPSRAIGPVAVHERWLVDELEDAAKLGGGTSNAAPLTRYAPDRYCGERSLFGFADPTKPLVLEYKVRGGIDHATFWVYHVRHDPTFTMSDDGVHFVAVPASVASFANGQRRLYSVEGPAVAGTILRATFPPEPGGAAAVGRVEIAYDRGGQKAP
ncbi:MAG TPA: hypothetical protein VHE61_08100 [Opitutaceae bacterium]|nr:hypothetical protein [Opitutaceae bacterium]